jgi:hypothetical protein
LARRGAGWRSTGHAIANTDGQGVVLPTTPRGDDRTPRGFMDATSVTVLEQRGPDWVRLLVRLFAGADLEHPGAAHWARSFGGRPAILHRDLLWIDDFALGLALHAIACGSRRGLSHGHVYLRVVIIPR